MKIKYIMTSNKAEFSSFLASILVLFRKEIFQGDQATLLDLYIMISNETSYKKMADLRISPKKQISPDGRPRLTSFGCIKNQKGPAVVLGSREIN